VIWDSLSPVAAIAILGPGGVGGFLAGALARASEDVVVIAREPTAELIARDGLEVRSVRLGDFHIPLRAAPELDEAVDALLVTPKATGLEAALERIKVTPPLVVPLLNGLDHIAKLRERFDPATVAAGVIRIEADRPAAGRIVQTSPFLRVDLASDEPALDRRLRELAETLERAGVPAIVGPSEAQVLWSKLVRLTALALTTSFYDQPLGVIRSEHRDTLATCIRETTAVANADGATIDPSSALQELDGAHAELGSSMQRDIAAGREPELDAIAGSVLRAAARHGVDCPAITRLAVGVAERAGIAPPRTLSPESGIPD
jgi:2-dehydropantoate 2-reductase